MLQLACFLFSSATYQTEVRAWLPSVLPKLLPYLTSRETQGAEVQSRVISVKMALLNQHRRVDTRKLKDSSANEQVSLGDKVSLKCLG